ncbi:hypothetical protein HHK36_029184 [Tetracentron sinense]|uniref:histidine kinase n=1 Tax=Tetracentron sinense TaxID=13715 RepID=A0A835D3B8_TETSI|nr:hypothetical protein HHK36_029184 [Tetracentron sinense]
MNTLMQAFVVLLIPSVVTLTWYFKTRQVERDIKLDSFEVHNESLSEIETIARLLVPISSSATNFARVMSSSLNGIELSFSEIDSMVAPYLFLALSTIPHLSQISYIGLDGLFFSYYKSGDEIFAVYFYSDWKNWYTQPVNRDNGLGYGEVTSLNPLVTVQENWFQEALNSTNGYASLGIGWNNTQERLFLNAASVDGRGVISLGFPVAALIDFFSDIDLHGGYLYLATEDGEVLNQTGPPNTSMLLSNGTVFVKLMDQNGDLISLAGNISCNHHDGAPQSSNVNIQEMKYAFYCSHLVIAGVQSVYVLAFPRKGLVSLVHNDIKLAQVLLLIMLVCVIISIFTFVFLIFRAARREMFLCAALMKQMEATQQAERKSMNKSLAFARASHDVRSSLAAFTGLIELCNEGVAPDSELAVNLKDMKTCTIDLLRILNSVLDTSKIEAGKMQLEEEDFNLAQLLEDVVDMFHPVGIKKGVDVMLDLCDASIIKFSHIKGDRGKLKQILCNLLSNAVKFTSDGHVSVRTWVTKLSSKNSIIASNRKGILNFLSPLLCKNNGAYDDLDALHTIQQNQNCMEFLFEVDDTGKGIPKEKQKSVFENFVQVKGTALEHGGTGLGLGIVQSLVRLMGGEIRIVDKEPGETGTCFKFNIFFTTCEAGEAMPVITAEEDIKFHGDNAPSDLHQHIGLNIRPLSPKAEGSHVVLLIKGDERRRISQKFMESLGIKVLVVKRWYNLFHTLEWIERKLHHLSLLSSSTKSELSKSVSHNSNSEVKDEIVDAKDGTDHIMPLHKKTSFRGTSNFILIVIDISAGPFSEMCSVMAGFKEVLYNNNASCKVVWLDTSSLRGTQLRGIKEDKQVPCDHIISKPFHGSRLYQVIGLLPEYEGVIQSILSKSKRESAMEVADLSMDPSSSAKHTQVGSKSEISPFRHNHTLKRELIQEDGETSSEKPLSGKKILVVEDDRMLRKVAMTIIRRLGAVVETCENGEEALEQVCNALSNQRTQGASKILPYDYILMDCEMPKMNGYETTRQIRKEEKWYDIHIPIIALTANAAAEDANKTMEAGMDFFITKPLKKDQLLDVIRSIATQ